MDSILKHSPQIVRDGIQSMDYAAIDQKAIRKMDNKDFAKWQADRSDSLHHQLFANQEWSRRLLEKELKSSRFFAILGVSGSVGAAILGAVTGWLLSSLEQSQNRTLSILQEAKQSQVVPSSHPAKSHVEPIPENP